MNNRPQPPALALRLLKWFCKPYYLEIIEGDLFEIYDRQFRQSQRKARLSFYWNAIRFFRIRYIKNLEDLRPQSSIGMFKNYFKVALRNMRRQLTYTVFNLLGLAVGVAACLLIIMHVSFQLSYNNFMSDADRIYHVANDYGGERSGRLTPARLVKQMLIDYPEIESGTRVGGPISTVFQKGDEYITQGGGIAADSTFFDVFPTTFLQGQASNALNAPGTLVLTQSVAEKFFPGQNPVGQIMVDDGENFKVTAVVADPPLNTTMPYQFIKNIPYDFWATTGYWTGNNFYSYLKLKENADKGPLEAKFPGFVQRYIAPEILSFRAQYDTWEDFLDDGNYLSYKLVSVRDIHLKNPSFSLGRGGSEDNVIIFSIVAFFILLIACINYVNMSTARSTIRAKEVGMRKVLGSVRKSLIQQFLTESLVITLLAVIFGALLALAVLPFFADLTGVAYSWQQLITPGTILWMGVLIVVIGLLAGSYPALFLSSFQPITALRGAQVKGSSSKLRTGLVVLQFAISAFLISGTFIVYTQVKHMSTRKLGVEASQVFVMKNVAQLGDRMGAFRNSLLQRTDIQTVSGMSHYPSGGVPDWGYYTKGDNKVQLSPDHVFADEHALSTLGLTLAEGAFFQGIATDTANVVVNETFVRAAGWDEPVGQLVDRGPGEDYRVIGVVKDFVMRSGKRNPRSLIFRYSSAEKMGNFGGPYLLVNMTGDVREQLSFLEGQWNQFVPGYPFDGLFLDESFDRLYNSERRFGQLFTTFSGLAIVIACIGLFALAAFTLERRLKEIAIRKVLGATVNRVVRIIVWDFLKLILMGSVLAIPIVFYFGNDWLNDYDYRIAIDAQLIMLPILIIVAVALLTIGFKTWRTADDNPVNALKQE